MDSLSVQYTTDNITQLFCPYLLLVAISETALTLNKLPPELGKQLFNSIGSSSSNSNSKASTPTKPMSNRSCTTSLAFLSAFGDSIFLFHLRLPFKAVFLCPLQLSIPSVVHLLTMITRQNTYLWRARGYLERNPQLPLSPRSRINTQRPALSPTFHHETGAATVHKILSSQRMNTVQFHRIMEGIKRVQLVAWSCPSRIKELEQKKYPITP